MTFAQMTSEVVAHYGSLRKASKRTGVGYSTLSRIINGIHLKPHPLTLKALTAAHRRATRKG